MNNDENVINKIKIYESLISNIINTAEREKRNLSQKELVEKLYYMSEIEKLKQQLLNSKNPKKETEPSKKPSFIDWIKGKVRIIKKIPKKTFRELLKKRTRQTEPTTDEEWFKTISNQAAESTTIEQLESNLELTNKINNPQWREVIQNEILAKILKMKIKQYTESRSSIANQILEISDEEIRKELYELLNEFIENIDNVQEKGGR